MKLVRHSGSINEWLINAISKLVTSYCLSVPVEYVCYL